MEEERWGGRRHMLAGGVTTKGLSLTGIHQAPYKSSSNASKNACTLEFSNRGVRHQSFAQWLASQHRKNDTVQLFVANFHV